jgi:heme/copper-type cytochrome/quinol oxidase subunit 4
MSTTFVQRKLLNVRSFEILSDSLKVRFKTLNQTEEFSVPFEELGTQISTKKVASTVPFLIAFVPALLLIILVYFLAVNQPIEKGHIAATIIFGVFAVVALVTTPKNSLYLSSAHRQIEFYRDKPNNEAVDAFVKEVIDNCNEYLRMKYAKVDPDLPVEPQLNSLTWMKNRNLITDEEFEQFKSTLLRRKSPDKPDVGFKA